LPEYHKTLTLCDEYYFIYELDGVKNFMDYTENTPFLQNRLLYFKKSEYFTLELVDEHLFFMIIFS